MRELDVGIEMGLYGVDKIPIERYSFCRDEHGRADDWDEWDKIPKYSTEAKATILLIEIMSSRGYELTIFRKKKGGYEARFTNDKIVAYSSRFASTISEAIALAAYKALVGKKWNDNLS